MVASTDRVLVTMKEFRARIRSWSRALDQLGIMYLASGPWVAQCSSQKIADLSFVYISGPYLICSRLQCTSHTLNPVSLRKSARCNSQSYSLLLRFNVIIIRTIRSEVK